MQVCAQCKGERGRASRAPDQIPARCGMRVLALELCGQTQTSSYAAKTATFTIE